MRSPITRWRRSKNAAILWRLEEASQRLRPSQRLRLLSGTHGLQKYCHQIIYRGIKMVHPAAKKRGAEFPHVPSRKRPYYYKNSAEEKLEQGLEESMAGSDPVSITQPTASGRGHTELINVSLGGGVILLVSWPISRGAFDVYVYKNKRTNPLSYGQ